MAKQKRKPQTKFYRPGDYECLTTYASWQHTVTGKLYVKVKVLVRGYWVLERGSERCEYEPPPYDQRTVCIFMDDDHRKEWNWVKLGMIGWHKGDSVESISAKAAAGHTIRVHCQHKDDDHGQRMESWNLCLSTGVTHADDHNPAALKEAAAMFETEDV